MNVLFLCQEGGIVWVISDMRMTNRRIADIAIGGEARKKAVLSERKIVTTGYLI